MLRMKIAQLQGLCPYPKQLTLCNFRPCTETPCIARSIADAITFGQWPWEPCDGDCNAVEQISGEYE